MGIFDGLFVAALFLSFLYDFYIATKDPSKGPINQWKNTYRRIIQNIKENRDGNDDPPAYKSIRWAAKHNPF